FTPWRARSAQTGFQSFADWILSGPKLLCCFLANDDDVFGVAIILICEVTTAHNRNTHRAEIPGSDCTVDDIRLLPRGRIRDAFYADAHRVTVVGEGNITRYGS